MSRKPIFLKWMGMLLLILMAYGTWCFYKPATTLPSVASKPLTENEVDLEERPLGWIAPGTVVETKPPEGWSHLLYVVHPRIGSGDVKKVSKSVLSYATLLTINCLGNVVENPEGREPRYHLERVAIGLGTEIRGKNIIITSQTQKELGANLDFFARQLLSHCEADFRTGFKQIARTSTMLVYDSDAVLLVEGEHRKVMTRHVILVCPSTGELRTLLWAFDQDYELLDRPVQNLPPNFQEDQVLNVKADRFFLGLPGDGALGQIRIAEGVPIAWTDRLKRVGSRRRFTKKEALELEDELHALLFEDPKDSP